ncbi:MAG: glycosyltransferase [Bacteroidales bacterium]|nr:glycosyltransferase [Bacteroidales bacterium]MBD5242448.1 glycosyltransferase [Barnesiella sp.]
MIISIITATYNSANTIRDTFESVLSQTYNNIEYIVIDGASTDGTIDIIKEYEPRFQGRLKWISEPDNGLYDAMNKGIEMATGEIVGILNSDDFFSSTDILKIVATNIIDVDAVYGDIHYVNSDNLNKSVRKYSSKSFRRWKMIMGFMPAHPSFYCHRRIYQQYGLFDTTFKVAADFEQLLRLIYINNISIRYIPVDFVTMRTGGASSSGISSHKKIIKDHLKAYKKNNIKSNILFESCRYLYRIGQLIKFKLTRS